MEIDGKGKEEDSESAERQDGVPPRSLLKKFGFGDHEAEYLCLPMASSLQKDKIKCYICDEIFGYRHLVTHFNRTAHSIPMQELSTWASYRDSIDIAKQRHAQATRFRRAATKFDRYKKSQEIAAARDSSCEEEAKEGESSRDAHAAAAEKEARDEEEEGEEEEEDEKEEEEEEAREDEEEEEEEEDEAGEEEDDGQDTNAEEEAEDENQEEEDEEDGDEDPEEDNGKYIHCNV